MRKQCSRKQYALKYAKPLSRPLTATGLEDEAGLALDSRSLFTAIRAGTTTSKRFLILRSQLPQEQRVVDAELVRLTKILALKEYSRALARLSSVLNTQRCWEFLEEFVSEAQNFGVEDDLRHLVFTAAGRFADVRMLRQTAVHRPR